MNYKKLFVLISLASVTALFFINCGEGFQASTDGNSKSSVTPNEPSPIEWVVTPISLKVQSGARAEFTALAKAGGPVTYKWFLGNPAGNTEIPGSTSGTFVIPKAPTNNSNYTQSYYYYVVAEANSRQLMARVSLDVLGKPE